MHSGSGTLRAEPQCNVREQLNFLMARQPPGVDNGDGEGFRRTETRPLGKASQNDALHGGVHVAHEAVQARRRDAVARIFEGALAPERLVENQAQRIETTPPASCSGCLIRSSHIGVATIQRAS